MPIVEKLDPYMIYILYKLFRDSTRYVNKDVVKDLSYLGRDLKKVVMLDTLPKHFELQPENAIHMQPWNGDRSDRDLIGLIPFLEAIAIYNVPDVRPILQNYSGKHVPTAWAEVERKQKAAVLEEWEKDQAKHKFKLGGGGYSIGSLFGVSNPQAQQGAQDRSGPPKTELEMKREFFQKSYLEEQKYWAENKETIEKAIEEDKERMKREMQGSVMGFFAAQFGMAPPPGAPGQESAAASPVQPKN